ncbi:glycosyl hydrolase family 71-domain-containing protein [Mycena olivaceomarginata]|nr:glycosyl hydrolase family 71-domain-containing protein [Mycena olivaceomarginata]
MRLLSLLAVATAVLPRVSSLTRDVFAHYMVGNILQEHANQDIDMAKAAGFTGFSLNVGAPDEREWVQRTLDYLFARAVEVGGFYLHISMDMWASGDENKGHPDKFDWIVQRYLGKPGYFTIDNRPWQAWKLTTGMNLYFCPDFDGTPGYVDDAPEWWDYWGSTVDCVLSWDASWQARPGTDPSTGKPYAGSPSPGSILIDSPIASTASQKGKGYNIGFSLLQYKNAYNTNVYRDGGLMQRMVNILNLNPPPTFATALTWNDGPESHYIGPIWGEQNTDTDPARYVNNGPVWSHTALLSIIGPFAVAFANRRSAGQMMPQGSSEWAVGALWYKTIMQGTSCPNGDHPDGWTKGNDDLSWGLVLRAGRDTSQYRLYLFSGSSIALHTGFKDGLNFGTTPISPGVQRMELYDGQTLIYEAKGPREVHSDCPDGIFNMNVVAGNVIPPQVTQPSGQCTFHFVQYQKPNPVTDPYTFDLTLIAPSGVRIGRVTKAVGVPGQPIFVPSSLSSSLAIWAGNVDSDPVTFTYEGHSLSCTTGKYDSGNRDGDCGFSCSLPPPPPCTPQDPPGCIRIKGHAEQQAFGQEVSLSLWDNDVITCSVSGAGGQGEAECLANYAAHYDFDDTPLGDPMPVTYRTNCGVVSELRVPMMCIGSTGCCPTPDAPCTCQDCLFDTSFNC